MTSAPSCSPALPFQVLTVSFMLDFLRRFISPRTRKVKSRVERISEDRFRIHTTVDGVEHESIAIAFTEKESERIDAAKKQAAAHAH